MRPARVRANALPRWQARSIIAAALAFTTTGLLWQAALLRRGEGELPGPFDPWLARAHGLAAMAGLFAFGLIASRHVGRGWSMGLRRKSGLTICILFGAVALSGYALAYLAPEQWHAQLGWSHSALGLIAFALGAVHRR